MPALESRSTPTDLQPLELLSLSSSIATTDQLLDSSIAMTLKKALVPRIELDLSDPSLAALALDDSPQDALATNPEGEADLARYRGIYSDQIRARIERIWRRPRSPVLEEQTLSNFNPDVSFQCEAEIVQDSKGMVQEVLLPRCNGSSVWQRSLVTAILQASPLPAPPDPQVFRHIVTLDFIGFAYTAGASRDEYDMAQAE